jgi:LCP family protein required for cell wall assembly
MRDRPSRARQDPGTRNVGAPAGRRPHRWRDMSPLMKAGYIVSTLLCAVILGVSLTAYAIYRHLGSNIHHITVAGLTHRSVYGVQNILVLGSQTRKGQGRGFGQNPSLNTSNSDNLMLVHLDPTHTHATVLSIPRDTIVYEPGCKARAPIGNGIWGPYQQAIIDGAMNIGGPSCAVKTVEDLTDVRLDHFVMFDFNSFRAMVDAIGGVEVCVPRGGYHDPYSRLNLKGGKHLLTYNQALAYVRTRHGVEADGDVGGDLPRIMLQQAFTSSVIQKVNSEGILSNAVELLRIANTATHALTVDQGLDSISKLLSLARSLIHLRARNVTLITMPTVTDTAQYGRLLPEEPQDDVIFQMLRDGQLWQHGLPVESPGQVRVRVLNGTGLTGLAGRTARGLRKLGFDVVQVGNAAPATTTTVTYKGTVQADGAWTLMTKLKATPTAQNMLAEPADQAGTPGAVTLILGSDFAGVKPPAAPRRAIREAGQTKARRRKTSTGSNSGTGGTFVQTRNAGAGICTGLPKANPDPGSPP